MIPKEKAIELVEKYGNAQYGGCMMCDEYEDKLESAKQCALIAVDEILDVLGGSGVYSFADSNVSVYWEVVKKEIEQL